MPKIRLDKLLADRSPLSRSEAILAIRRGRVQVAGETLWDPAAKVDPAAPLTLDEAPLTEPPAFALFHKALDVQCTVGDPLGRINLSDVAGELLALGLHPVGRLDADTSGLLLFSRDGALTQRLLHPRHAVWKVYAATVEGKPTAALAAQLAEGVEISDGVVTGAVRQIEGAVVTLAVSEGKHRMVRRMLNNAGFPVVALRRLAFGPCELGDLPVDAWRAPTEAEAAWARSLVG
jgi:23S rRNA pseudouridine2605 synthase